VVASVPEPELGIEADEHISTPAPKFVAEPATSEEPLTVVEKLEAEAISPSIPEPEATEVLVLAEPEVIVSEPVESEGGTSCRTTSV
jgi:hypothetical protein